MTRQNCAASGAGAAAIKPCVIAAERCPKREIRTFDRRFFDLNWALSFADRTAGRLDGVSASATSGGCEPKLLGSDSIRAGLILMTRSRYHCLSTLFYDHVPHCV